MLGVQLRIEWIEKEFREPSIEVSAKPSTTGASQQVKLPPAEVLDDIIQMVDVGDFAALERTLEELLIVHPGYADFCAAIREHASQYDDEAILEYVDRQRRRGQ